MILYSETPEIWSQVAPVITIFRVKKNKFLRGDLNFLDFEEYTHLRHPRLVLICVASEKFLQMDEI